MAALVEKGAELAAAAAGSRAMREVTSGRFRKALIWGIPAVVAGVVVWYMRRNGGKTR